LQVLQTETAQSLPITPRCQQRDECVGGAPFILEDLAPGHIEEETSPATTPHPREQLSAKACILLPGESLSHHVTPP
jgi:hypothetical protein